MTTATRNYTVDIFRLLASFFIVFLHVGYDSMNPNLEAIIRISGRWGVPFFFLLSGYFFQNSLEKDAWSATVKSCIKIFNILITADIIYILAQYVLDGAFDWKHLFPGAYFHLWFLPSLALGTITLYFYHWKKVKTNFTSILALIVICIVLIADSYAEVFHLPSKISSGYVIPLLSIPFMTIGSYFHKYQILKNLFSIKVGFIFSTIGFILQLTEILFINIYTNRAPTTHQYLIGTLFLSIGIFILAFSLNSRNKLLGQWGQDYSLFIYLFHPLIILIFYQVDYKVVFNEDLILLFPVAVFAITLLIAILTDKYLRPVFLLLTGAGLKVFSTQTQKYR